MSVYIISNDLFLENGIIELGKKLNVDVTPEKIKNLSLKDLKYTDSVIINLNLNNKSCSKEISKLYNKCKVMIILNSQREIIISQSDAIVNSRKSLAGIQRAIYDLVKMEKSRYQEKKLLSNLELKIISETFKGINIDVIARDLVSTPVLVPRTF